MLNIEKKLREEYLNWNMKKINFQSNSDFVKIETPFLDPNNDYIYLYLERHNSQFNLTDDGYAVNELDIMGIDVRKKGKRRDYFLKTLRIFGVHFDNGELYITFDKISDYPVKQHMLLQAIVRINDMLLTTRNKTINFFTDDIQEYLLNNGISITPNVQVAGKTGNMVSFDFSIGMTKQTNQKLIKAVYNPTSEAFKDPLFSFIDIEDNSREIDKIIIANDVENKVSKKFNDSIINFSKDRGQDNSSFVNLYLWSDREKWIKNLKSS
ncbi:TPA: DUF1828 domain-containing protein [Listeria monocytogenes]|uniref:DUF1828 domain-containing protein n=1 Tax=Listeria TaxID=1637 RepID=UPI0010B78221|nr:DUF1828 domain-containing protein [Listeria innocua]EAC3892930.1 DUF1828 domain-containing protein [Listeria monocytogenes]EAC9929880.1 DUF1828 domain-containing protein [Listeria monocytogenes]EAC9932941.1 DUF1828 domain-containing protein [Listeria monocytogenes]EAC9936040.1 DUF1828 domain-containing protein [Listeria monocytogenes]EAC9939159.1 DUF1828 domain-containing protein [Listeria monocytogenes]